MSDLRRIIGIDLGYDGLTPIRWIEESFETEDKDIHGEFSEAKNEIRCSKSQTPVDLNNTLIHECLHAILYYSGHTQYFADGLEEAVVTALANSLSKILTFKSKTPYIKRK